MAEETKVLTVTEEGLKKLQDDLAYLVNVKRPEVTKNIGIARGFGDLSENSEYDEAKNEQAKVEAAIAELEEQLKHVRVVAEITTDSIGIGTKVMVRDLDFEEDVEYTLVGSNEANALENKISDQSPIGSALMGKHAGDSVEVQAPNGMLHFKVLHVERTK